VKNIVGSIIGLDFTIEVKPPDLIVKTSGGVHVIRYLIGEEANFGIRDLNSDFIKRFVEIYSTIMSKLPEGSEIKIVKQRVNLDKLITRLSNEMMNLKALIEVVEEPHVRRRASVKLKSIENFYELILKGVGVSRINLVVKIRESGSSINEVRSKVSSLSTIVKNLLFNELGIRVREANYNDIVNIIRYELGLVQDVKLKSIILDNYRVFSCTNIPLYKKPSVENYDGIPIGMDLETGWPIIIPFKELFKHMVVIGPTGRGKTTFLATLIEGVIALSNIKVVGFDFKGDLVKQVESELIKIVIPEEYPVNILYKPEFIDVVEWSLIISDTLSNVINVDPSNMSRILSKIQGFGERVDFKTIMLDQDLSILTPLIEFLTSTPRYEYIDRLLDEHVLFNLYKYGTSFQNIYANIVLGIIKKKILQSVGSERLIIVDEAWRISKSRILIELVKEGRSRSVGVVLATQNPTDLPREIIENAHHIVIFGSPNEDYRESVRRILGVSQSIVNKLTHLNIGEAIVLNALDPNPMIVRIKPPLKVYERASPSDQ